MTKEATSDQASSVAPKIWQLWTGRVLTALPVLVLVFSASMKISHATGFVEIWTGKIGFQESTLTPVGLLELACVALYLVPRTAVLGALLLTAYLGGAVATHARVGDPFVIPMALGILVWGGIYLRNEQVRALLRASTPIH